ncbi:PEGA domain-containing protein [Sorangium sp. So ce1335]|uniref:PEGA domain-containing protein n=1 Tax=Sorangium sp. So ce1335 TaxID=3133335 RepID=UPI003F6179B9
MPLSPPPPPQPERHGGARCPRLLVAAAGLLLAAAPTASGAAPADRARPAAVPAQTATAPAQPTAGPAPPAAAPAPPAASEARERAAERYATARAFYERRDWSRALAEYLASRQLYASWAATSGAALSLTQLGRHDEALEMFEALLRDFGDRLPTAAKEAAQRQLDELRQLVGILEVDGAEPGALIVVDGRHRGEAPLPAPLRLTSGSHWVRVFKEGFEPFEQRVEMAGDRLTRVRAQMRPLARMGRLRVIEEEGRPLDVVVDGNLMARAPWEGLLAPGEHTVALRGEGRLGTPPVRVEVEADRTVPLTLSAEELAASLRVEPVPVNATVAVDGVTVGRGLWEGRLRAGAHRVEIAAPGFLPESRRVILGRDQMEIASVTLERDPSSPFWRKPARPARFVVEATTGVVFVPSFGGEVAGTCIRGCETSLGTGGSAVLQAGYELGMGLGFGVTAGYVTASQRLHGRHMEVTPVGLPANQGTVDDRLALRGALLGGWLGFTLPLSERVPLHFRLGAGAIAGALLDQRTGGAFRASSGAPYELAPFLQDHPALFLHATPEVRVGLPVGRHVQLNAGIALPVLIDMKRAAWDTAQALPAGEDGRATFPAERLAGPVLLTVVPGIGARYEFY